MIGRQQQNFRVLQQAGFLFSADPAGKLDLSCQSFLFYLRRIFLQRPISGHHTTELPALVVKPLKSIQSIVGSLLFSQTAQKEKVDFPLCKRFF